MQDAFSDRLTVEIGNPEILRASADHLFEHEQGRFELSSPMVLVAFSFNFPVAVSENLSQNSL